MMKTCIDKIARWIRQMGLSPIKRGENRIVVAVKASSGSNYKITFEDVEGYIHYEAVVWKAISGRANQVTCFYEVLLGHNSLVRPLAFSLAQSQDGLWYTTIGGSQECRIIDPENLKYTFDVFDLAYSEYVPTIKSIGEELKLKFDGVPNSNLSRILEEVFTSYSKE